MSTPQQETTILVGKKTNHKLRNSHSNELQRRSQESNTKG